MAAMIKPEVDVRRSRERMATRIGWLDSRHSFSFGPHHEPANTHFGVLLVNNDDRVRAGAGFETHPHRDMEIVTWVLAGELEHADSQGNRGSIYPGLAQRMTAGTGIWHSEKNLSAADDVHFVQMWVVPDVTRADPGYQQLDINGELGRGGLVPVASGRGHDSAISIRQRGAVLWAARLAPREAVTLPDAPFVHLFVARGSADLAGQSAGPGADEGRFAPGG
ncbi:MAG: pirin family protein, partial [Acidimicrobiales bacterium]